KGTVNGQRLTSIVSAAPHSKLRLVRNGCKSDKISTLGRTLKMGKLPLFQGAAAAAILGIAALTGSTASAEDFCDTSDIMSRSVNRNLAEKQVREKCKIGDIVFVDAAFLIPRLCDLREPVIRCGSTCPGGDQSSFCFLAPPRKVY
ncbi:MAG: hypothetical protein WA579_17800, partial [Rhodomicrobium sp.]